MVDDHRRPPSPPRGPPESLRSTKQALEPGKSDGGDGSHRPTCTHTQRHPTPPKTLISSSRIPPLLDQGQATRHPIHPLSQIRTHTQTRRRPRRHLRVPSILDQTPYIK